MTVVSLRSEHRLLTQARIVEAARGLFASSGYFTTRMDEVARAAGVSRTTLYLHFPRKSAIMEAILDEEIPRFAGILTVLDGRPIDRTILTNLVARMAEHYRTHASFVAVLREAVLVEDGVARRIDQSYHEVIAVLMRHLAQGQALSPTEDRMRRTRLYICLSAADSMLERCLHPEWEHDRDMVRSELVALWCSMFGE